ncbi:hypothetical protein Tco_0035144, partial [Tanacetum coccineum]
MEGTKGTTAEIMDAYGGVLNFSQGVGNINVHKLVKSCRLEPIINPLAITAMNLDLKVEKDNVQHRKWKFDVWRWLKGKKKLTHQFVRTLISLNFRMVIEGVSKQLQFLRARICKRGVDCYESLILVNMERQVCLLVLIQILNPYKSISSGIKSPLPGKFIIFYSPFLNSRMAPNTRSSATPLNNDVNIDDNVKTLEKTRGGGGSQSAYTRIAKLKFPKFSGEDVNGWVFRCEQFFAYDQLIEAEKVHIVSIYLHDKALLWHNQFIKSQRGYTSWGTYKQAVLARFGTVYD